MPERHEVDEPAAPPRCEACGALHARRVDAPGGPAWLCATCARLEGLGCP